MRNLFWATYEEAVEEEVEGNEVELLVRDAVLVVPIIYSYNIFSLYL